MKIRDATPADFEAILRLNQASVHYLSPLDTERLAHLHAQAVCHRVAEEQEEIAGFLLALREGADYDSVNYGWFARQYGSFLYIDRVVVNEQHRGRGIGRALYRDVFQIAAALGIAHVTCEFDIEPPNEVSTRFHAELGFKEVGSQWVADGKKRVSLQALELPRVD